MNPSPRRPLSKRRRLVEGGGSLLDPHTLHLVLPISPSRNQMDRWHHARNMRKLAANTRSAAVAVAAALGIAFGTSRWPRPWATTVLLSAIRCSTQRRRLDVSNVIGGLKAMEDALVSAGLIVDDNPQHVRWGPVEDRVESMWRGAPGPATHLFVARITTTDGQIRQELEALDPIVQYMGRGR